MNQKDFEELKKGLFFAEKQIENLTVCLILSKRNNPLLFE
jgi:hypothetical protein